VPVIAVTEIRPASAILNADLSVRTTSSQTISERTMRDHRHNMIATLCYGAVAGAVATWVMGKATDVLYEREDQSIREREDNVREGETAYSVAAEKAANRLGVGLSKEDRERYGSGIHWALGVGTGVLYGILRDRIPPAGFARGLVFGTAFWLLVDEGANYALGLTPGPTEFPWQTHARGLIGHLVYGTVAEATIGGLHLAA
jgi:hypothetical protein